MLDPQLTDRIRRIFLHPRPHVSIATGAALLGWTLSQMKDAIVSGEVEVNETPLGEWIWREQIIAKAIELWPQEVIEEALGSDAERVLPHARRLALLRPDMEVC